MSFTGIEVFIRQRHNTSRQMGVFGHHKLPVCFSASIIKNNKKGSKFEGAQKFRWQLFNLSISVIPTKLSLSDYKIHKQIKHLEILQAIAIALDTMFSNFELFPTGILSRSRFYQILKSCWSYPILQLNPFLDQDQGYGLWIE